MRVEVPHGHSPIGGDGVGAVDRELFVGVDGDQDNSWEIFFLIQYHSFQNYYLAIDAFRTF